MDTLVKKYSFMLLNSKHLKDKLLNTYPWVVIVFASLFLFYKYILQVSPSVMTQALMQHFQVNGAGLGNLSATFFYAYLIVQLFVGPLLDKYSPRLLTAVAIAVSAAGTLWFAESQTLLSASLARGLVGVGVAFATISYMKMAATWFKPQYFAFVGGLLATAAMLGSIAGQIPLSYLVAWVGWHSALFYCGLVGIAFAASYYLVVRNKPQSTVSQTSNPLHHVSPKLKDFVSLLKKKHNWLLMFYSGLAFSPLAVFGGLWGNPFLQEAYHLGKSGASILVSCTFVGLALGAPLLGVLSVRFGKRFEVMLVGLLLSLLSLTLAIYLPDKNVWFEGTLLFFFGFGTGAFMLGFVVGKEINSVALAASVIGLINTGDALFGAFSEPLAGKVLDIFWQGKVINGAHYFSPHDYHLALLMLPLYLFAAIIFLLCLRRKIMDRLV